MSLSDSQRLRIRLDALTWRLQEADDEVKLLRKEASTTDQVAQDARLAHLFGEEAPVDIDAAAIQSELMQKRLAASESLVERLQNRRAEAEATYSRALRKEWTRRVLERWRELCREESKD